MKFLLAVLLTIVSLRSSTQDLPTVCNSLLEVEKVLWCIPEGWETWNLPDDGEPGLEQFLLTHFEASLTDFKELMADKYHQLKSFSVFTTNGTVIHQAKLFVYPLSDDYTPRQALELLKLKDGSGLEIVEQTNGNLVGLTQVDDEFTVQYVAVYPLVESNRLVFINTVSFKPLPEAGDMSNLASILIITPLTPESSKILADLGY